MLFWAIRNAVARAHGDYGSAVFSQSLAVKYLNTQTGVVFLRCRKSYYRVLWSALPFINRLDSRSHNVPCSLTCLHVGGTIRTLQKFLIRYNTRQIQRLLPHCRTEEERAEVRRAVMSCSVRELEKEEEEEEED
ncbi:POP5 protein, partial [Amia calva]|nr:POP5 protein [Amia calva]